LRRELSDERAQQRWRARGSSFIATISGEQLDLLDTADLVVWNVDTPADRQLVERDPIYRQLAVAREGRDLFLDEETNAALSFGKVLSIPFLLDELVPELAATVAGG
jgi:iron complex transport system substrate-binding protein